MPSRLVIGLVLTILCGVAAAIALTSNIWLLPAAFPFAFGAYACLVPRPWLANEVYRATHNAIAYFCIIPAGVAIAASVGVKLFAVLALPALCVFVFLMWTVKRPVAE